MVEIILSTITDLSDVCDLNKNHETYIEKISGMINFIRKRGVKPGCKTLTRETKFSDFTYGENNAETMNSARDIINSKMNGDKLVKQWKTNHDGEVRAKTKLSKEKYGKNSGENSSHQTENQKTQKQAQPSPWVTTPWEHQHTQKNCELLSTNPTYQKSPQYQKS